MEFLSIAQSNLASPIVLSFVLGLAAALARSDLSIPEAAARMMSVYLLFAIGFKGGAEVARQGLSGEFLAAVAAGIVLSVLLPFLAFLLLRLTTGLSTIDAAATAGHYGSISIVTFVAATQAVQFAGLSYAGHLVAVAAAMEAPAIVSALYLAFRYAPDAKRGNQGWIREVLFGGSIVLLVGSFAIGLISGDAGYKTISGLIEVPFKGVLCLFLLDMGLLAGRHLLTSYRSMGPGIIAFGLYMPLVGALCAVPAVMAIGFSPGSAAVFMALAASASYIAVPAALRIALPQANPAIYLTLSLGLTFPFNLTIGIPAYIALAEFLM